MSNSEYIKIHEGQLIENHRIIIELNNVGIHPIIKDESESYRLSGVAPSIQGFQKLLVRKDEYDKAMSVIRDLISKSETGL